MAQDAPTIDDFIAENQEEAAKAFEKMKKDHEKKKQKQKDPTQIDLTIGDTTYEDIRLSMYEIEMAETYHDMNAFDALFKAMSGGQSAVARLLFISTLGSDPKRDYKAFMQSIPFGNITPLALTANDLLTRDGAAMQDLAHEAEVAVETPKKKGGSKKKKKSS